MNALQPVDALENYLKDWDKRFNVAKDHSEGLTTHLNFVVRYVTDECYILGKGFKAELNKDYYRDDVIEIGGYIITFFENKTRFIDNKNDLWGHFNAIQDYVSGRFEATDYTEQDYKTRDLCSEVIHLLSDLEKLLQELRWEGKV